MGFCGDVDGYEKDLAQWVNEMRGICGSVGQRGRDGRLNRITHATWPLLQLPPGMVTL